MKRTSYLLAAVALLLGCDSERTTADDADSGIAPDAVETGPSDTGTELDAPHDIAPDAGLDAEEDVADAGPEADTSTGGGPFELPESSPCDDGDWVPVEPTGPLPGGAGVPPTTNACGTSGWLLWEGRVADLGDPCGCFGRLTCGEDNVLTCEHAAPPNACGGCLSLNYRGQRDSLPGDSCGTGALPATLACFGPNALVCEGAVGICGDPVERNDLPTTSGFSSECDEGPYPGDACGPCGVLACWGSRSIRCIEQTNECGLCGPLAWDGEAAEIGGPCGECGTLTCGEGGLQCEDAGANLCGGCGPIGHDPSARPGDDCETVCGIGVWECGDQGTLQCSNSPNACGGCGELRSLTEQPLGSFCGACGAVACIDDETVDCFDPGDNGCGGCSALSNPLGTSCGRCGTGEYICDGPDRTSCGNEVLNACGGCEELEWNGAPAEPGDPCSIDCATDTLGCRGREGLRCLARFGPDPPLFAQCGSCGHNVCVDETIVCQESTACESIGHLLPTDGGRPEAPVNGTFGRTVHWDGDQLLVGADKGSTASFPGGGRVWLRAWNGEEWAVEDLIEPPIRHANQRFGNAIAVEDDLLAISARNDDGDGERAGAVYLFERRDGRWRFNRRLAPPDPMEHGRFGWAVDICDDRVFVSQLPDPDRSDEPGTVYVFDLVLSWTPPQRLDSPATPGMGWSVSCAGETVAFNSYVTGEVHAFERRTDGWELTLTAEGSLGHAVAATAHGLVIGGYNREGLVAIERAEDGWSPDVRTDLPWLHEYPEVSRLGYSVSVHGDVLIAGAPRASWLPSHHIGVATVWTRSDEGEWVFRETLAVPTLPARSNFGFSVAFNGRHVAVGAPSHDEAGHDSGAVWVFTVDPAAP